MTLSVKALRLCKLSRRESLGQAGQQLRNGKQPGPAVKQKEQGTEVIEYFQRKGYSLLRRRTTGKRNTNGRNDPDSE